MEKLNKERLKFIDYYAEKIKNSKDNSWRKEHSLFINSQINNANQFYERLILLKNGKEKFMRITGASKKFTENFYNYVKNKSKINNFELSPP